jgi:hypothetical protein
MVLPFSAVQPHTVPKLSYGKKTVKVARLDDFKVGFGQRRSLAVGKPSIISGTHA